MVLLRCSLKQESIIFKGVHIICKDTWRLIAETGKDKICLKGRKSIVVAYCS